MLVPIHSKPLSGQQCLADPSVNVYLRGDFGIRGLAEASPHYVSSTGFETTLQTLITSGNTSPSLSQKIPPFPLTYPNVSTQIFSLLNALTFGQQAINVLSGLDTFLKLAPLQASLN